jgi:MoxR-like ATPase
VPIAPSIRDFGLKLVAGSHPHSDFANADVNRYVRYGASPRAAQAIILCSKVYALMAGRFNVSKNDIKKAAIPALRHRVLMNYKGEAQGITSDKIVEGLLAHIDSLDRDPVSV